MSRLLGFFCKTDQCLFFFSLQRCVVQSPAFLGKIHWWEYCEIQIHIFSLPVLPDFSTSVGFFFFLKTSEFFIWKTIEARWARICNVFNLTFPQWRVSPWVLILTRIWYCPAAEVNTMLSCEISVWISPEVHTPSLPWTETQWECSILFILVVCLQDSCLYKWWLGRAPFFFLYLCSIFALCFLSLVLFNTLILGIFFFLITGTIFNKIVKLFVCVLCVIFFKGWRAFTRLAYTGVTQISETIWVVQL